MKTKIPYLAIVALGICTIPTLAQTAANDADVIDETTARQESEAIKGPPKSAPKPPQKPRKKEAFYVDVERFWSEARSAEIQPWEYALKSKENTERFSDACRHIWPIYRHGGMGQWYGSDVANQYLLWLEAGNPHIKGAPPPMTFFRKTHHRFWAKKATYNYTIWAAPARVSFAEANSACGRFSEDQAAQVRAKFHGVGEHSSQYLDYVRNHVSKLSDKEAVAFLKNEMTALAKRPASKARDAAVSEYLSIIAIRREIAEIK
jgi:hypothetical protein